MFLILFIGALYLYLEKLGFRFHHLPRIIREVSQEAGWLGPFVILFIFALQTVIPFPNLVLSATVGALYGPWFGSLLVIVGWLISATISFYAGRYFGRHWLESHASSWLRHCADLLHKHGFMAVTFLRLVQTPADVVGILCGMTRLSYQDYILASFIGVLPSAITFTVLGRSWANPRAWLLFGIVFVASLALAFLIKKFRHFEQR